MLSSGLHASMPYGIVSFFHNFGLRAPVCRHTATHRREWGFGKGKLETPPEDFSRCRTTRGPTTREVHVCDGHAHDLRFIFFGILTPVYITLSNLTLPPTPTPPTCTIIPTLQCSLFITVTCHAPYLPYTFLLYLFTRLKLQYYGALFPLSMFRTSHLLWHRMGCSSHISINQTKKVAS